MVYLLLEDSPAILAEKEQEAVIQRKIEAMQRFIRGRPRAIYTNQFCNKATFSAADKDFAKCTSRCSQVRTNYQSKRNTK
jgi:hypothetical protein